MKKNNKVLNFDMDGTIADLYSIPDWLDRIRAFDATPYAEARPMVPMSALARQLNRLQKAGYKLRIISWSSKESTPEYDALVDCVKRQWLAQHLPSVHWDEIIITAYGVPKQTVGQNPGGILFDDNMMVREEWDGFAFCETQMMEVLRNLGR